MKPDIHPDYHPVVFQDAGTGKTLLIRSTVTSDRTIDYQGVTYPLVVVDVTADSYESLVDAAASLATEAQREGGDRWRRTAADATAQER